VTASFELGLLTIVAPKVERPAKKPAAVAMAA
jgi:hypothetical protein